MMTGHPAHAAGGAGRAAGGRGPRRRLSGLRCAPVAAFCLLAGCQQPGLPALAAVPEPVLAGSIGYLVFDAPVVPRSRDLFIADVDRFRDAGAKEIDIAMNSAGGDIDAAQAIVDHMTRLHEHDGITFKAYNLGLVASAAAFVFLTAQDRYSVARGMFLFHAAGMISDGLVSVAQLREQADRIEAYERTVRATLRMQTRLTDSEAQIYLHETILLSADEARRNGIVDGIAAFPTPKDAKRWVIAFSPSKADAAASATSRPPG